MLRITFLSLFMQVGLGATFTDIASAEEKKKNPANAAAAADSQLIKQLETIRANLNKADHDYEGHRATAVREITHAIHFLQHGEKHPKPAEHFKAGAHKEPQALSDAQLKQSLAALQSLKIPLGKHQTEVEAALQKAMSSLKIALKVK